MGPTDPRDRGERPLPCGVPPGSGCPIIDIMWILWVAWLAWPLSAHAVTLAQVDAAASVATDRLSLVDRARNRDIPVAIYTAGSPHGYNPKPAILSHGYGGKNTDYGFIARDLATRGYYVASIQHEIAGDEPLPTAGNPYETRKPSWERGVQSILFVIGELKKTRPDLIYEELLLVGHSHGGDMSMLFARDHPRLVHTVISLDSRRMPFPRAAHPRILSIRSSDQAADEGVIPSPVEQATFGMKVVQLPATIHNDMWDGGTEAQKAEIVQHIGEFLSPIPPDEAALIDLQQSLAKAWLSGDRVSVERIIASDWTGTGPDARVTDRADVLEQVFDTGAHRILRLEIEDVKARVFGDAAVVTGRTHGVGEFLGAAYDVTIRFTDTFVRRDGRWQAVASHASLIPPGQHTGSGPPPPGPLRP